MESERVADGPSSRGDTNLDSETQQRFPHGWVRMNPGYIRAAGDYKMIRSGDASSDKMQKGRRAMSGGGRVSSRARRRGARGGSA